MRDSEHATHLSSTLICHEEFLTNISATKDTDPSIATASSKGNVWVHTLMDNNPTDFKLNLNHLVELKFDRFHNNLLWTATYDGTIDLWDLRTPGKAVSSFTDTSDSDQNKKFNCFDISPCGKILCAGTDRHEEDSYLLFWDLRKHSLVGGFWESHMDDITQVKFHPNLTEKMFSASTDGLINVYDLNQTSEDDALIDTLNTESSIEKINFSESRNVLSCITHTSDVQFWKEEGVQPFISMKREEMAEILQRESGDDLDVIDVHQTKTSDFVLVAVDSNNVRGLIVEGTSLVSSFGLNENDQVLKCSWFNENSKILLTGGEKGKVDAWKLDNIS